MHASKRLVLAGALLACAGAVSASDLIVYDNASENGFDQSCSFGGAASDFDFANISPVHSGGDSIRFTPDTSNAVGWCTPSAYSAISDHSGIDFWIYMSDSSEGDAIALVLGNAGNAVATQSLQTLYGSPIPTNTWVEIQTTFASAPMNYGGAFDQVYIQDESGALQASVYLDDVALMGSDRIFADGLEASAAFTVTASASTGNGAITPASQDVDSGSTATFRVTPDANYNATLGGDTCTATQIGTSTTWVSSAITQDCAVTATFALKTFNLTLATDGSGSGSVMPSPVGTSCGSGCYIYNYGALISITATPSAGSNFTTYSGNCATTNPCAIQVTGDTTITATFTTIPTYQLQLSSTGNGFGTVTPSPVGTSCGTGCFVYDSGASVEITATPSTGSTFTSFSGGGCSTTNPCGVTVTADTSVAATFTLKTYNLTLAAAGNGSGTVTPSPVGTSCGSNCYTYAYGTFVSVSASPSTGSTFTSFSGGGCSTTNPCGVTVTAGTTVTATFM